MWLLAAICLVVQEQYPFSHFPMYSSFGDRTYYIYLADGAGQPLPTRPTAGMTTPTLQKVFDGELRRQRRELRARNEQLAPEHRNLVAARVLERVKTDAATRGTAASLPPVLRLYQVNIRLVERRYEKQTLLLAQL